MPLPATLAVCQLDLFTDADKLREKYDDITVQRIIRVRQMYEWMLANPSAKDREFITAEKQRTGVSESSAYSDLAIVKTLLPCIASASRDYHRWRTNEMFLETYQMAKARKDTKTMGKTAADYAKYNRVDLEDEQKIPYDEIVVQPFTATADPSVLGIKPIPNIQEKISAMLSKYRKESMDIEDVEFEEADIEEAELFNFDDGKEN